MPRDQDDDQKGGDVESDAPHVSPLGYVSPYSNRLSPLPDLADRIYEIVAGVLDISE